MRVLGNPGAILQPDSFNWDPSRGAQQVRRWRGPKKKIFEIMAKLSGTGIAFTVNSATGATWEITATASFNIDGAAEQPVDIWECTGTTIGKDVLNAPACSGISDPDMNRILQWIQNPPSPDASGNVPEPTPALTGSALTALRLIKRGAGFQISQPLVRHTQVVSNAYAVRTAWSNVGAVFKLGSLGVPGDFLLALPGDGSGTSNVPGGSHFGYLKKPPQIQTAAYRRRQIVVEWEYGEFSDFLYGVPV